jgi:hypothetical protein
MGKRNLSEAPEHWSPTPPAYEILILGLRKCVQQLCRERYFANFREIEVEILIVALMHVLLVEILTVLFHI